MTPRALAGWRRRAIRQMTRSRADTLAFLARLPAAAILRPRTQDQWSIKDVLAHIAAWEDEGARRLRLIARGQGDRIHFFDDMRAAERFNVRAVAVARRLSLAAMLGRLAHARQRLQDALARVPDEALHDSAHAYPVTEWLPEFAWTHERGHVAEIRTWWRGQRAAARAATPARRARGRPAR